MNAAKAYILGVLCGDGWVEQRWRVGLAAKDIEFVNRFVDAFDVAYGAKPKINTRVRKTGTIYQVAVGRVEPHRDIMAYFSGVRPMSDAWRVPEAVKTAPEGIRSEFLRGFFDSEGWVSAHKEVKADSINIEGLNGIGDILTSFGISWKVLSYKYDYMSRPIHYLVIPVRHVVKFAEAVGFSIRRKADLLMKACAA